MLRFDQVIGSDGVLPTAIVGIHCHLLRHHCYSSAIVRFPLFRSVEWNHPPSSIFSLIPVLSQLTRRIYITLHDCIRANFLPHKDSLRWRQHPHNQPSRIIVACIITLLCHFPMNIELLPTTQSDSGE